MTTDEKQMKPQDEPKHPATEETDSHPIATSLGAVGGGVAGSALGRSIGGKFGAIAGGIAGAIAGGIAGNTLAEFTDEVTEEISPTGMGLGANHKPIELPRHFTWEQMQALSKPQGGDFYGT